MRLTQAIALILVVTTQVCAAAEPRLQRDVDARRVKLLEPLLLAPHQASARPDAPWAKDAAKLTPIALWHVQPTPLDWWSGTREVHDREAARVHARAIVASECDDAYALFAAAWMLSDPIAEHEPKAGNLLTRAYLAVEKAGAHPLVRFLIAQRLRSDRRSSGGDFKLRQRLDQEWPQYAVDAIASGAFGDAGRDIQAILIQDWDDEHPEYVPPRDYLRAIADSPKVDDWFEAITRGRHEVEYAWVERGNRWGHETTPEQMARFRQRLDAAARALEQAWTLRPNDPTAPALMVKVETGRGTVDAALVWLERAMAVQIDHPEAWLQFMMAALPRWGGSTQDLLRVAEVAEGTGRYDTRVPFFGINALKTLAHDDRAALQSPDVYAMVKRICAGYRGKLPPGMDPRLLDSVEAAFAVRAGAWKDADVAFKRAGGKIDPEPFTWVGYDVVLARLKSAALASPAGALIERAVAADDAGDAAAAREQYRAAAALIGDDADAARYLNFRVARLQFVQDFLAGKKARLFDPAAPERWLADQGDFKLQPDGSLRVEQKDGDLRAAFRPPFSGNFALGGKIVLDAEKAAALPEVYILPGVNFHQQSRHYAVAFNKHLKSRVTLYGAKSGAGRVERNVDFANEIDFVIEVVRERVTVRVNGNTVFSDEPVASAARAGTVGVWIHNFMGSLPAAVTIRDLAMQKLDDDGRPVVVGGGGGGGGGE